LDHDPTPDDIRAFLGRLPLALRARDLTLCGLTTDGSALYPIPLLEGCGDVPHQIGTFPIVAAVTKAVLGAVARARKGLAATQPPRPRGRPRPPQTAARRARRRVVRPSVSVCPTSPAHNRPPAPVARQPWLAPVTRATGSPGTGVGVI
jgi:hypothetical protein